MLGSRGTRRTVGRAIAAISALVLGILTLTPGPAIGSPPFGHWCLVCGPIGVADAVANVVAFAPLGVGLAMAGMRARRVALVAAAYSLSIELAQYLVVTGRFATLSDVVTNTTGAAFAAGLVTHRRDWMQPGPRAARWLAGVAALGFVSILAATGWVLARPVDPPSGATPEVATPAATPAGMPPGTTESFGGQVLRLSLDGVTTAPPGPGPVALAAPARRRAELVAELRDPRGNRGTGTLPVVVVHGSQGAAAPWLMLGQAAGNFVLEAGQRARQLRLRQPTVAVRDRRAPWPVDSAFRDSVLRDPTRRVYTTRAGDTLRLDEEARVRNAGEDRASSAPFTVRSTVSPDRMTIAFEQRTVRRTNGVRLAPTVGWALLSPFPAPDSHEAGLATALWLAGLALPLGYFGRWAVRGGRRAEVTTAAAMLATLAAGLLIVPAAWGYAPGRPWEWVAAVGGVVCGAAAAATARHVRSRIT